VPKARHRGLIIALVAGCAIARFAAAASLVGTMAPALRVASFGGEPFDLAAHRGQVVIINYWASWCVPCRQEMPELDKYYRDRRSRGLAVIAMSVDRAHDLRDARKAADPFSYPAALAAGAEVDRWPTPGAIPTTYIVDASGRVRDALFPGKQLLTHEWLETHVDALIDEANALKTAP